MWVLSRMLFPISTLAIRRFKKKKYYHLSQDQKTVASVKNKGLRDKRLAQFCYSIQHIEGYDLSTNNSATFIQDLFHNTWLARYPLLQFIVFDNANIGYFKRKFKQMWIQDNYGIKFKPNTSHNHSYTSTCNH
jgi:hypothetical protein